MTLGPAELLIVLLLLFVLVIPVWAVVDASIRTDGQWAAIGQNEVLWVVLLVVGIFVPPLGIVLSIVYLTTLRPKLPGAR